MSEQRPPTSDGPESVDGLVPADDSPLEMRRRSLKAAARVRRWVKRAWRAVCDLSPKQRAALILRIHHHREYPEVAPTRERKPNLGIRICSGS